MPKASIRKLGFKARDAGSSTAETVLTMAAHAVQHIASAGGKVPAQRRERVTWRLGDPYESVVSTSALIRTDLCDSDRRTHIFVRYSVHRNGDRR